MKKCVLVGSSLLILILGVGSLGYGAEANSTDQTGVYTLGEVVVTAQSGGVESVGTVTEITAKDIEDKNARTLDEALELLPGLDVRTGGNGIPRIRMRGFTSRHVVLLLNGIPYNSTYDGQFDPSIIPTENIAKIKVTYGTSSVLYSQGGLGGVINIVTKKGTQGFSGSLSGEVGERGQLLGRFNMSGGSGPFDYLVSGSAENSDGFRLSSDFDSTDYEDGGLRENSDRETDNLFANLGYSVGKDWKIGLTVETSSGEFGKPPQTKDKGDDPYFLNNPKYDRVEDYDGFSTQLAADYDPDGPFGLRMWVFYNELEEDLARYDGDDYDAITKKNSYRKDDETRTQGGSLQASYDFDRAGYLTGAFSYQQDKYDSDGDFGNGNPIDADNELATHSLALEYTISPLADLEFVVGYSHHWLDKKDGGNDDDKGSYLLGARYRISEETQVRASFSRKIRFPSIKQLYDTDDGNSDLNTEKSTNYELGITQQLPWNVEADLVGFLNDVDDYIEKLTNATPYENLEEYRFMGIQLFLEKRFLETGSVRAGYTYMDSEDRSSGAQRDEMQYRPEHKATLEGRYSWNFGLSAYASFMYVVDQYYYSRNAPLLKRKLDNYSIVDVKLEQRIVNDLLYAYVGANNILDKDYEESYCVPQAGRLVYCGLKVVF